MSLPKFLVNAHGSWAGSSKLHQSWLKEEAKRIQESRSHLHVEIAERETFATIEYAWEYEGKREEGRMIVAANSHQEAEIGWSDSWHMSEGVLFLKGKVEEGAVQTLGSYSAGKETWGWTVRIEASESHLAIKMDNVTPAGEHIWAVDGEYHRA